MKKNDSHHPPSEDLFAFRDGELLPEKRGIIEAHVMGCSVCRSFIDQVSSLEAELRQSPDRAPAGYFEALQEKVRARIAVAASESAAAAEAPADRRRSPRGADAAPGRHVDDVGARRERGRVKEAPVLPWAAVISTASAAAAVLVVVAILIKQGPYQRMVTPKVPKTESPSPVVLNPEDDGGGVEKKAAGEKEPGIAAREKGATRQEPVAGTAPPAAKPDDAMRDRLEKAADRAALKSEPVPEQFGAVGQEESRLQQKSSAAPRGVANEAQELAPAYAAVLSRFGLPPLWDADRVSPEALANAEPDLRSLYVSGGAGHDSARVRLYLAEAVRLRYAPGDSTLYDEIQRHYRRAIDLAGPDAETARVAEERLRSLEK
jgi:hypothetical protein